MTSPSPTAVKYEYDADYLVDGEWKQLPVVTIVPSVDADRVPYAEARLTLTALDETTFAALDPRTDVNVRWRIRQLDLAGNILNYLPRVGDTTDDYALMHPRTITRTLETVTVELSGGESLIDDKLCLLAVDGPGPNATPRQLVNWVLELVTTRARPVEIPERVIAADDHAAEVIDTGHGWFNAGDSSIRFGESYLSGVETELNSRGVRLVDAWGIAWYAASRGLPPTYTDAPDVVKLGTYTTDTTHTLPDDVDPIVTDLQQTVSRDGNWADTVVVHDETTDGLYSNKWEQFAGTGQFNLNGYFAEPGSVEAMDAQSRARTISLDRGNPTGNLAGQIAARAATAGHGLTITARTRFDVLPGMTIELHLRDVTLTATILAVDWAPEIMTIRALYATTPPPVTESETGSRTATPTIDAINNATDRLTAELAPRITGAEDTLAALRRANSSVAVRDQFGR